MRVWRLIIAQALVSACCHAGPYDDLVVFGDSLSDVGNTDFWTGGFLPGSDYFEGRFSNGPTYAERVSEGLGFGPLLRDGEAGDNFAYGGAETNGPGFFQGGALIESFVASFSGSTFRCWDSRPTTWETPPSAA